MKKKIIIMDRNAIPFEFLDDSMLNIIKNYRIAYSDYEFIFINQDRCNMAGDKRYAPVHIISAEDTFN